MLEEEYWSLHEDELSGGSPPTLREALEREYAAALADQSPPVGRPADLPAEYPTEDDSIRRAAILRIIHRRKHAALCVSGGGIRSATFGLGVIQGLARRGLLDKFHYLSTVSGGGYLGSWLTAWAHHHPEGLEGVIAGLAVKPDTSPKPKSPMSPEPEALKHLRAYSNYLSPKLGLLSADTWTLIGIYLRNLLLNWLVLIPLVAAVLAIARVCVPIVRWNPPEWARWASLFLGFALASAAIAYAGYHRPSAAGTKKSRQGSGQIAFLLWCLAPLVVAGMLLTSHWAWIRNAGLTYSKLQFVYFGMAVHLAAWLLYTILRRNMQLIEPVIVIATGALGGWFVWLAADNIYRSPEPYVVLALPLFLGAFLLAAAIFIGIISRYTDDSGQTKASGDADREWWARLGGWVLIVMTAWSGFSVLVFFGPILVSEFPKLVAAIGSASGLISVGLGGSGKTPANKKEEKKGTSITTMVMDKAAVVAAPLFAIFVVIMISLGDSWLIKMLMDMFHLVSPGVWTSPPYLFSFLHDPPYNLTNPDGPLSHMKVIRLAPFWLVSVVGVALAGFGLGMGLFININKFSLHSMYRNRLIRAYLGASRGKQRKPNLFTGFDEDDNIKMHRLWPENEHKVPRNKLLPVVNVALNLVAGKKLAWQERKATTFTFTPLHAGNFDLGYRTASDYAGDDKGVSLGTAVAISGAAVSPNMGYHSSSVVTFLLTLFNARLGWWLGNPKREFYSRAYPKFSAGPMIGELLGLTDEERRYVYLSDGGHFENLGLYEMVLRRCHFIVVSDGSQDGRCTFEDLGGAIRKIRIDLGIPIDFEKGISIYDRSADLKDKKPRYCAIGKIRYSRRDGPGIEDGILVYIKPAFYQDDVCKPRDVFQYAKRCEEFPHESTADQFFSESQFESYRALGAYAVETMAKNSPGDIVEFPSLKDFVKHVEDTYLKAD